MPTVAEITQAIEEFAPRDFQESYDNAGLQVGNPDQEATAALLCLDVTEEVVAEAERMGCNLIISHHPLLFKGLKRVAGLTPVERIVIEAVKRDIAIYAAHTNLDAAWEGVSHEIARRLELHDVAPLSPRTGDCRIGLGVVGQLPRPLPALEFLRELKERFHVKALRYSGESPQLVVNRVAACGGAGASLLEEAVASGADVYVTGDVKYHDFTSYAPSILIADIGHYEGEICTKEIFSRIIREKFPNFVTYFAETDRNPVRYLI